ncbi:DUF3221 domain-containing protein [Sporosarcina sp. Marseille-Q4063]|uniref:DUF3221 domain-containing protein n=1 Tax=Sporosarcina sp. Marseille-Q4063 TaxID=2810514 RepID=UPI001BAF5A00|nr:DUF3221 domain-containing protein [Sporosarcina sp. Marseille-Q4063]QUW23576.1 DUF3221 domain-containing protein [Sporosarcina sp. Marseille-Q4063]
MKVIHSYKPFLILIFLLLLMSCSQIKVDKDLVEMKGYVLAKEIDTKSILVVPNINGSDIERVINGKLEDRIVAQDNGGVNFYVSIEAYENMKVGDQVLVKYDQFGDVEESDPPNRKAESVEVVIKQ